MTQILLLGDDKVGKTSLIEKMIQIDNLSFQYIEFKGQLNHISELTNILENVQIILLLFDITIKSSFDSIEIWYNLVKNITNDISKYIFYLVSTKNDKKTKIDYDIIEEYFVYKKMLYYYTSINCNNSITKLIKSIKYKIKDKSYRCDCCTI